jgi:hypothetical protein
MHAFAGPAGQARLHAQASPSGYQRPTASMNFPTVGTYIQTRSPDHDPWPACLVPFISLVQLPPSPGMPGSRVRRKRRRRRIRRSGREGNSRGEVHQDSNQ